MKMHRTLRTLLVALLLGVGGLNVAYVRGQGQGNQKDDYLYNQIVFVEGNVRIVEPASKDSWISVSQYLIFQRTDCKRCFIATTTDTEGNYRIRVSRGRYRVIVRQVTNEGSGYDLIAPGQPRYLDANKVVGGNRFDIKLVLPASTLKLP